MRHSSNNRRGKNNNNNNNRGRISNGGNKSPKNQVFDSNGPEVRLRGNAQQIAEKYEALAKDAKGTGDESLAENYLQHAEHYQRLLNSYAAYEARQAEQQAEREAELALPESVIPPANRDQENEEESELEFA